MEWTHQTVQLKQLGSRCWKEHEPSSHVGGFTIEGLRGRRCTSALALRAGGNALVHLRPLSFPQIWLVVTSNEDKLNVGQTLGRSNYAVEVFSVADVTSELEKLERAGA